MKRQFSLFNFSGIYDHQSFYRNDKGSFKCLDCRNISGTNCMCDDEAKEQIRGLISSNEIGYDEVHFIDSGNYHYMSKLLTDLIKEPFSLVVLDHHPDMQAPMFGDILSCGGWVREVLNDNPYVRDVHVIGADRNLIDKLDKENAKRACFYDYVDIFEGGICLPKTEYPVYLSIDKDVLSESELKTNWDQGEFLTEEVISFVQKIFKEREVIGLDICGEIDESQEECDITKAVNDSNAFNQKICDIVLE